jgi:hypothetical protein
MANCPNCGQATERTQDWACQWCGYPLVSGSFRQMSKTYQEVKAERLQQLAAVKVVETDLAEAAEVTAGVSEEAVESEAPEVEMVGKVVQVVETEQEKESAVEPESTSENELIEEVSGGVIKTSEPVAEAEVVQPPRIIPITIEELSGACEADSEAAEVRFAGSILQITAEVERIPEVESSEKPCIILTTSERPAAMNVLCIFDKQHEAAIDRLSEGQLVTVQGRYDGCVMNILVNDCVLVD